MTTYYVRTIHVDRAEWATRLAQALAAELQGIGLHRTVTVETANAQPPPDARSIAVLFASPAAKSDAGLIGKIEESLDAGMVVIPVVDDLASIRASVPRVLMPINAIEWSGDAPEQSLARRLLEELDIEDQRRRVFISHKREDGLGAAEQVHDALSHAGFAPFIDRFHIRPGAVIQAVIADALEDHAFLLLLETPFAHASHWVFDEVDYALSHTMGMLIVSWPGETTPVPGSVGVPRVSLQPTDIRDDEHAYKVLSDEALDRLVGEVEAAHARGLVRRRRMLVQNVLHAARSSGVNCRPMTDWRLLVVEPARQTVVGIAPRLPCAQDLQNLDEARVGLGAEAGVLVHAARALAAPLRDHLEWVLQERPLALAPDNAIGSLWRP